MQWSSGSSRTEAPRRYRTLECGGTLGASWHRRLCRVLDSGRVFSQAFKTIGDKRKGSQVLKYHTYELFRVPERTQVEGTFLFLGTRPQPSVLAA